MTDGLQPEYVDEPTCRVCGVALADHPRVAELCRRVRTLESHALESAEKLQRLATYETCTGEIECTCWGCLMDRSKWQKGELAKLKRYLASSGGGWTEVAHLTAERDRLKAAIATLIEKTDPGWAHREDWVAYVKGIVKEATDG